MSIPSKFSLKEYIKYLPDQENIDCCAASASLLASEILYSQNNRSIHFSRLFLYYMARKIQGRIGGKGASLECTLQAMKDYGVPPNINWPFTYARMNTEPSIPSINEARNFKISGYEQIFPNQFNEYISNNMPVIIGIRTGRLFWKLTGPIEEQNYIPIGVNNRPAYGHALTIIGYDNYINNGSWIVANSTGLKWGDKGYGAIPYSCSVDIGESFVITGIPGITVGKKISSN